MRNNSQQQVNTALQVGLRFQFPECHVLPFRSLNSFAVLLSLNDFKQFDHASVAQWKYLPPQIDR
jgi:hypothetical protein